MGRKAFEYKTVTIPAFMAGIEEQEILANEGCEGWEVCAINFYDSASGMKEVYFKREIT